MKQLAEKVLILSCNTGQGHNTVAKAIQEALNKRGVPADIRDGLAFDSEHASRLISGVHNMSAVYAPELFVLGNRTAERATARALETAQPTGCYLANARYAAKLYRYIREGGYTAAVMPHVFPAEAMTEIRRRFAPDFRATFVATDYACAPFVGETDLDLYCIPHSALAEDFIRGGVDPSRIAVTGIPVQDKLLHLPCREDARAALRLPQDAPVVQIMTGSMGYGHTDALLRALLPKLPPQGLALVLCGNNAHLLRSLQKQFGSERRVRLLPYCSNVETYLASADVLLTKPGGLSITEAAVCAVPTVLTAPLPGWEARNVAFFTAHGMAEAAETPEALASAASALLRDPDRCAAMRAAQRSNTHPAAAEDIASRLLTSAGFSRGCSFQDA